MFLFLMVVTPEQIPHRFKGEHSELIKIFIESIDRSLLRRAVREEPFEYAFSRDPEQEIIDNLIRTYEDAGWHVKYDKERHCLIFTSQ